MSFEWKLAMDSSFQREKGICLESSFQREKDLCLRTLCDALGSVKAKWHKIGIYLGIPHNILLEFKKEDDPLSAVLDYWLKGNATKPAVPISWRSIVKALRSEYIGESSLAQRIHQKYDSQQEEKGPSPLPVTAEPSSTSLHPDLEFVLEENLDKIITIYASYVRCVLNGIQEKGTMPEELKSFLLTLSASSKCCKGEKLALLSDKKSELLKQDTIIDIFNFLTTECASFLNYDIFQKIMTEFNIKDELKYPEHLKAYTEKHKISEFHEINPLVQPNGSKELILLLDIEKTCSLAKVNKLKKMVARALDLNPSALQIIDIREGCKVVVNIPAFVADAIFTPETVLTPKQEDELKSASVLSLSCNSRTFMEEKKRSVQETALKIQENSSISHNCKANDTPAGYINLKIQCLNNTGGPLSTYTLDIRPQREAFLLKRYTREILGFEGTLHFKKKNINFKKCALTELGVKNGDTVHVKQCTKKVVQMEECKIQISPHHPTQKLQAPVNCTVKFLKFLVECKEKIVMEDQCSYYRGKKWNKDPTHRVTKQELASLVITGQDVPPCQKVLSDTPPITQQLPAKAQTLNDSFSSTVPEIVETDANEDQPQPEFRKSTKHHHPLASSMHPPKEQKSPVLYSPSRLQLPSDKIIELDFIKDEKVLAPVKSACQKNERSGSVQLKEQHSSAKTLLLPQTPYEWSPYKKQMSLLVARK